MNNGFILTTTQVSNIGSLATPALQKKIIKFAVLVNGQRYNERFQGAINELEKSCDLNHLNLDLKKFSI